MARTQENVGEVSSWKGRANDVGMHGKPDRVLRGTWRKESCQSDQQHTHGGKAKWNVVETIENTNWVRQVNC